MIQLSLGHVLIPLLKGVLYQKDSEMLWQALLNMRHGVQEYVDVLGLECVVDETEGYAFLRQKQCVEIECDEDTGECLPLPKLIPSRPLGFTMSVLCLLLRKRLIEQDAEGGEVRTIVKHEQLIDTATVYLKAKYNEAKLIDHLETNISRLIDLGLLRPLKNAPQVYDICRIIKALVDADWVQNLNMRLQEYQDATIS
ncbi:MAG TPA: DUF4194 domain-containing protein [Gammaproteobacteria bacterium]|nr:DUF4194 domain-containing protein [Gammaproteobacteria bacterium]